MSRSSPRLDQLGEPLPIECGSRIVFASRRDIAMADNIAKRVASIERLQELRQYSILRRRVRDRVSALELNADREVVAAFASLPARRAGVPCALPARHEL